MDIDDNEIKLRVTFPNLLYPLTFGNSMHPLLPPSL